MTAGSRAPYPERHELDARLTYDPQTGIFRWRALLGDGREVRRWNARYAGAPIASLTPDGYVRIGWKNRHLLAHRVAWILCNGDGHFGEIDHINHDRSDNRIENLRLATRGLNTARVRAKNSGVKFRRDRPRKPWVARITMRGKQHFLGSFARREDATAAYLTAKKAFEEDASNRS